MIIFLIKGYEPETLYETKIKYTCKPGSQFYERYNIFTQEKVLECLWKKSWEPATLPECKVTHCIELATPLASLNYKFLWDNQQVLVDNYYTYYCDSDKSLESDTRNKSSAPNSLSVKCNSLGDFEYPENWPQCFETVSCDSPPNVPINGTREWVKGAVNETFYETKIKYACKSGSQFKIGNEYFMNRFIDCHWNKVWDPLPLPPCEITHCLEPHSPLPSLNLYYTWDNKFVPVGNSIMYKCKSNMVFEQNTTLKLESTDFLKVGCGVDGNYAYPSPWPQCSETISCGTPPSLPVNGSRTWLNETDLDNKYGTHITYKCVQGSKFDTNNNGVGDSENVTINCEWRKAWSPWTELPKCVITHCTGPPPLPEDSNLEELNSGWVPINGEKWYQCKGKKPDGNHTKFFESDRNKTSFSMLCKPDGTYNFINKRENWPTCLSNVNCGQPPNVTKGGTRTWLNGIELKDTYATEVKYQCAKGSQFDTNGDLEGDSESITTVCRWNKNWSPWSTLPQCYITHCVDPFYIPLNTSLEESTSEFPRINSNKEYRCSNRKSNGVHTKFFLHDHSKSSFSMLCLPNGTFNFLNKTENWPVCVEGKLHLYK